MGKRISIKTENAAFGMRAVGVAIHNNRVLIQQAEGDDFWVLPGGGCEVMETAIDTIQREMIEEINATCEVQRLLWVVELFFSFNGIPIHSLELYFQITFPSESHVFQHDEFFGNEAFYLDHDLKLTCRWHPLDQLDQIDLRPHFLRTHLHQIPESTTYIISREQRD